jgi:hypothetical protein
MRLHENIEVYLRYHKYKTSMQLEPIEREEERQIM